MTDRRHRPLTVRGVQYPSRLAAARALGVRRETISRAIARGGLDRVGLGVTDAIPVTIDGTTYPSQAAASRATGVPISSLR